MFMGLNNLSMWDWGGRGNVDNMNIWYNSNSCLTRHIESNALTFQLTKQTDIEMCKQLVWLLSILSKTYSIFLLNTKTFHRAHSYTCYNRHRQECFVFQLRSMRPHMCILQLKCTLFSIPYEKRRHTSSFCLFDCIFIFFTNLDTIYST